jgi:hypothetical protein
MNILEEVVFLDNKYHQWLIDLVNQHKPTAKAVAVIQMYNYSSYEHPSLRDKTAMTDKAVMGISGDNDVVHTIYTGSELYHKYGFKAVGAQFAATFKIIMS